MSGKTMQFSTVSDPLKWGSEGVGVICFASPEDAKKAEDIFNAQQALIGELEEHAASLGLELGLLLGFIGNYQGLKFTAAHAALDAYREWVRAAANLASS